MLETLKELGADGIETVATVVSQDAEPLPGATPLPRMALVFGNEGHGLQPECIDVCCRQITIPMPGGTDSLNVATASAIFLYHYLHRG